MKSQVIEKPDMILCDGKTKARIGLTYALQSKDEDGKTHTQWLRYQTDPKKPQEIKQIRCSKDIKTLESATAYELISDEKVKIQSLGSYSEGYKGLYYFSRFVDQENVMLGKSRWSGPSSLWLQRIVFDRNGAGSYQSYDRTESSSRYGNVDFDDRGGVSFSTSQNDGSQPYTRRDFFKDSPFASSLIDFQPDLLASLKSKTAWQDHQKLKKELESDFVNLESGLTCEGEVQDIICPEITMKNAPSAANWPCENAWYTYQDQNRIVFNDQDNLDDPYMRGRLSVPENIRLRAGDVFGAKFTAVINGVMTDVTDKITLNSNSSVTQMSPEHCRKDRDLCLGKDGTLQGYSMLFKVGASSGPITLQFSAPNGLTGTAQVYIAPE